MRLSRSNYSYSPYHKMVACFLAPTGVARVPSRRAATGFVANTVKLSFKLPLALPFGQMVAVVGSAAPLGGWETASMLHLNWEEGDYWTGTAEVPVG